MRIVPVLVIVVGVLLAPSVSGERLAAYDLVGTDATGDATNFAAPGAAASPTITAARTDVGELEMANDGDIVQFKLNIGEIPGGTGSYMYAVHFKVGADAYNVCWNIFWFGGQQAPTQTENTLGCSRFTTEEQVGPVTRAEGVEVASADGKSFVRWEVDKGDIGMGDADLPITDIVADTWFRGVSNCCAGSTTNSQYLWNRADVAPDTGVWSYAMTPAAPAMSLALTLEPTNVTAAPGQAIPVSLAPSLLGNGSVNFTWTLEGLPAGWNGTFDPANGTLASGENVTHNLTITVPTDSQNETVNLTVVISAGEGVNASANLTITVDDSLVPTTPGETGGPTSGTGGGPSATNETGNATANEEPDGIPAPGLAAALVAIALLATLVGRKRRI